MIRSYPFINAIEYQIIISHIFKKLNIYLFFIECRWVTGPVIVNAFNNGYTNSISEN